MREISRPPAAFVRPSTRAASGGGNRLSIAEPISPAPLTLKDRMYCANCGLGNEATARFCVRCGVALAAAAAAQPAAQPATYPPGTPYAQASTDPYAGYPQQPGYVIPTQRGLQHPPAYLRQAGGNPGVATVLSVIIPGMGQIYNADMKKGLVMLFAALVGLLPFGLGWLAVMVWSAIDAYQVAAGTGKRWD